MTVITVGGGHTTTGLELGSGGWTGCTTLVRSSYAATKTINLSLASSSDGLLSG